MNMLNKLLCWLEKRVNDTIFFGIPKFLLAFFIFLVWNILQALIMTAVMHKELCWSLFGLSEVFLYYVFYQLINKKEN